MPRDNLLNSICLDLFMHIAHEGIKQLLDHIVETYRDRLLAITYVDVFHRLVHRYDQMHYHPPPSDTSFSTQAAETPNRPHPDPLPRWLTGMKQADPDEESYFDSLDTEDDVENSLPTPVSSHNGFNGSHAPTKSLVAYPEDDEDDAMDVLASDSALSTSTPTSTLPAITVPSNFDSEPDGPHPDTPRPGDNKRRRSDDEEELSGHQLDGASHNGVSSTPSELAANNPPVQGMVSFTPAGPGATKRRFSLTMGRKALTPVEEGKAMLEHGVDNQGDLKIAAYGVLEVKNDGAHDADADTEKG